MGAWADGLLTVSALPDRMRKMAEAFRRGGGAGKRLVVQVGPNWAPTEARRWPARTSGGA